MIPKTFTEEIQLSTVEPLPRNRKASKQADGSVVVRCGDCMLLATAVSARKASPVDFLPLTVDYREKFAAAEDSRRFLLREARQQQKFNHAFG